MEENLNNLAEDVSPADFTLAPGMYRYTYLCCVMMRYIYIYGILVYLANNYEIKRGGALG